MPKHLIILLLFFGIYGITYPQSLTNLKTRSISLDADTVKIDSLSIVPGSVLLYSAEELSIPDSLYKLDYAKSLLITSDDLISGNYYIRYRTFPYDFSASYFHKDIEKFFISDYDHANRFQITTSPVYSRGLLDSDDLNSQGNVSRGFTVGNNQDVVVNSNFNLQLSGKIAPNLNILAAISDNNIPIQPDGYSQQLQEFDKIFIQVYNDQSSLTAGDIEITRPEGYFLNVYKKAQGGMFSTTVPLNEEEDKMFQTTVSGAVAKGKYCRYHINGREGVLGPYKLRGCDNEQFIVVLAGSEKVYIDGRLMQRGLENDYIIDYNSAEITFTPNQPITKDRRITVEFEYSDKNYIRLLLFSSNEIKTENSHFWINVISESDNRNQTLQIELDDDERELLSLIGDNLHEAIVPNIDSVEFNNSEVLYEKRDTIVNSQTFTIYFYSTNPQRVHYRLGFSYVGENNGNYVQARSAANGRVFSWVAPLNGIPTGSYEPVVLLVTPKKQQMVTLGGKNKLDDNTNVFYELALSNLDINTFSEKDSHDNTGYSLFMNVDRRFLIPNNPDLALHSSVSYRHVNEHFSSFERFRTIEFERDWNLTGFDREQTEHLIGFSTSINHLKFGSLRYQFEFLDYAENYTGLRNMLTSGLEAGKYSLEFSGSTMTSKDELNSTFFGRYNGIFSRKLRPFEIGVESEGEYNTWYKNETDSLLPNSFSYNQLGIFLASFDTSSIQYNLSYRVRNDFLPFENSLNHATFGEEVSTGVGIPSKDLGHFRTIFTYRKLSVVDTFLFRQEPENSITGRFEHNISLFTGAISSSTFYETGTGLETRKEFTYLEVAKGQGVYTWNDYNQNNVKELDEFEIAAFADEANYIRVFIPTDDYMKVYTNQLNQVFNLNPVRIWRNSQGIRKGLSYFSNSLALRLGNKSLTGSFPGNINPFQMESGSGNIINLSHSVRNTFSFNRTNPRFGMDYVYQDNMNKDLLANGFDTRRLSGNGFRVRWNIFRSLDLINSIDFTNKSYDSEFFSGRNYDLKIFSDELNFNLQISNQLKLDMLYVYTLKDNQLGIEKSEIHNTGITLRYNILEKGALSARMNYIHIDYNGDDSSSLAYEMLNGLFPGHNGTWELLFQRRLSYGIDVNFHYNGRVSESGKTIHTGGLQLKANF